MSPCQWAGRDHIAPWALDWQRDTGAILESKGTYREEVTHSKLVFASACAERIPCVF